jgi:Flp pilus assembly protein CpaB
MSIPIDPARAVNGRLEPGDRVDVVLAADREVAIVVAGAEILAVHHGREGASVGAATDFSITLAVDTRESQLLAGALADGDLVVTRVTGAAPAVGAPAVPMESVTGDR